MSKSLNDIKFLDLLPSSIAGDDKFIAAAQAIENELKDVNQVIDKLYLYSDIDNLEEPVLKHLAWQWHVDFWDDDLSLDAKRILVKQAYPWHRRKGTPGAVEEVIRDVLGGGYIEEWWEYGGEPYHFRVFSNSPPEDDQVNEQLLLAIDKAKNKRSELDAIIKPTSITGDIKVGGAVMVGANITIYQE